MADTAHLHFKIHIGKSQWCFQENAGAHCLAVLFNFSPGVYGASKTQERKTQYVSSSNCVS